MSQLVHGGDGGSDANDHMVADEQNMTIIGEIEGEEQNTTIVQIESSIKSEPAAATSFIVNMNTSSSRFVPIGGGHLNLSSSSTSQAQQQEISLIHEAASSHLEPLGPDHLTRLLVRTSEGDFLIPTSSHQGLLLQAVEETPHGLSVGLESPGQTVEANRWCAPCGKFFQTAKAKEKHVKNLHQGSESHKCMYCSKSFSNASYLRDHERIHTTEKHLRCTYCDKTFRFQKDLVRHTRVHTGEKPYKCSYCDKCFSSSSNLSEHRTLHTGRLPYTCPKCKNNFRLWTTMNKHASKCQGGSRTTETATAQEQVTQVIVLEQVGNNEGEH